MVGFGNFINYGVSGMRSRPRSGASRQPSYGKRITKASYTKPPTASARPVQWPSVSAGIPPTQARQGYRWQPAPEESFPTINAIARGLHRDVSKETGISSLGDLFLRLVNKPEPVDPGEPTPDLHWSDPKSQFYKGVRSLNKQMGKPSEPTSKYLPPYERLKKNAKTYKINENKFNQQWMDWHNNVPGAVNPHDMYADPAVAPIKSGRGLRASLVGGPAEKVESPYVRGKRHAKTHGVDEQTYDQQWMDWHNNVPGAIDPNVAYAEPKKKETPPASPIRNNPRAPRDPYGGAQSRVQTLYDRLQANARTHGVSGEEFKRQWMAWEGNDPNATVNPHEAYAEAKPKAPKKAPNKTPQSAGESSEATSTTPAPQAPRLNPDGTKPSAKEALVRNIKKDKKGPDNE